MLLRQNSRRVTISGMDMLDIWGKVESCANFCWTIWRGGSTGTERNRALTSKDVITSPGSNLLECISWTKCWVFLKWWGDWPTSGLMMYANSFATPYVMETLLDTKDLRGFQLCLLLGGHKTWGKQHLWDKVSCTLSH